MNGTMNGTMSGVLDRKAMGGFALGVVTTVFALAAVPASGDVSAGLAASTPLSRAGFHRTIDDVLDRYVDPVRERSALSAGLHAVLGDLDAYSYFLTASERKALQQRIAAGGATGLEVVFKLGGHQRALEIAAVEPDSPAASAGLRPGDQILRLQGRTPSELPHLAAAQSLLLGPVGERVSLTVQRQQAPSPETVVLERRSLAPTPAVTAKLVKVHDRRVLSVRIRRFTSGAGQAVRRALERHGEVAGVLLDLRGNPGGLVDEALVVADLFVDKGLLMRTRGRDGRVLREERAHVLGSETELPIVVLQDAHSASAAELLAAALRDHGRARIVGQRSFGKGTIQEVIGLSDGSLLRLTTARYRAPSDRPIDGVGVAPDVHVAGDDAIWVQGLETLAARLRA